MSEVSPDDPQGDLALVLSGGGARGAYQAGVIRGLVRHFPRLRFPLITGVSAGAINATFMAAHPGPPRKAAEELCRIWSSLQAEDVFRVDTPSLARHFIRWGIRLLSGGATLAPNVRGLVDTRPLYETIQRSAAIVDGEMIGIQRNLDRGTLKALALTALNYSSGQTVTWVQGQLPLGHWVQPRHRSLTARVTIDHVMASSALPLFFPAVRLGNAWFGDGGIRLSTPLVPALRLGATRILSISSQVEEDPENPRRPGAEEYPSPAQIMGHLLDSIFLDVLDEDIRRLEGTNQLLAKLPPEEWGQLRPVEIVSLRPTQSLGTFASTYEPRLPKSFRYLTRGLGTQQSDSSSSLSFIMFQPDYMEKLIEIGEADAAARIEEVRELVEGTPQVVTTAGS